jgi:hypothetical protein
MARNDLKNRRLGSQLGRFVLGGAGMCLAVLVALSGGASRVYAHSQPGVSGILDEDAMGVVHMLRLYQGLVQRDGEKWRFVCSKTYGGGGQDLAGALPGGGAVISLPVGIAIMKRDGTVLPHPDPESQAGTVTAFARGNDKLYALRWRDQFMVYDVLEITESTVRVLWTDTHLWSDIAVGTESLALVRAEQDEIEDLRLSFSGEVLSEDKAPLMDVRAVTVRVMGNVSYYAARFGDSSQLGRIEQGTWKPAVMARNAIAGPLLMGDGTALVGVDGVLSTFANDTATPLGDSSDFVTALYQLDGRPYACTSTGLRDLASTGLGTQIFDMSQLLGPDECMVPEAARNDCELEWQHLVVELLGARIALATDDDTSAKVCGAGAATAGAGAAGAEASASSDSGSAGAAGSAPSSDSAQAGAQAEEPTVAAPQSSQGAGCACGIVPPAPRSAAAFEYTVLVACGLFLRARRKYPRK